MADIVKSICCMRDTYLWKLFLAILIILYLIKLSAFFPTKWYYQGKGQKLWKGNIFLVYSSGGLINKETYFELADFYCKNYTDFAKVSNATEISYYDGSELCYRFSSLNKGNMAHIVFSVFSFAFAIMIMCTYKRVNIKVRKLTYILILNILQASTEIACTFALGISSQMVLDGDCDNLSIDNDTSKHTNTCAGIGPIYSLFASLAIICVNISVIICIFVFRRSTRIVKKQRSEQSMEIPTIISQLPILNLPSIPIENKVIESSQPEILASSE